MWPLVLIALFASTVAFLLLKRAKQKEPPDARYVCDVCNDMDCVCHEEKE